MIPGDKPSRITSYLGIDHTGEGYGWVNPDEGETFVGIPYGHYGETTMPFIEVHKGGRVVRTVNPSDLTEIEFADEGDSVTKLTTNP